MARLTRKDTHDPFDDVTLRNRDWRKETSGVVFPVRYGDNNRFDIITGRVMGRDVGGAFLTTGEIITNTGHRLNAVICLAEKNLCNIDTMFCYCDKEGTFHFARTSDKTSMDEMQNNLKERDIRFSIDDYSYRYFASLPYATVDQNIDYHHGNWDKHWNALHSTIKDNRRIEIKAQQRASMARYKAKNSSKPH